MSEKVRKPEIDRVDEEMFVSIDATPPEERRDAPKSNIPSGYEPEYPNLEVEAYFHISRVTGTVDNGILKVPKMDFTPPLTPDEIERVKQELADNPDYNIQITNSNT